MVLYNLTNFSNSTNILESVNQLNVLTNGVLVGIFLFTLFMISFGIFSTLEIKRALLAASFITTIASLGLWISGLVLISWVTLPFAATLILVIALSLED